MGIKNKNGFDPKRSNLTDLVGIVRCCSIPIALDYVDGWGCAIGGLKKYEFNLKVLINCFQTMYSGDLKSDHLGLGFIVYLVSYYCALLAYI